MRNGIRGLLAAAALLISPLALSACNGGVQLPVGINQPVLSASTTTDEKRMYDATAAYAFVAKAYLTANTNGVFRDRPATKAAAKKGVQELYAFLGAAQEAHNLLNAASFNEKLAAFYSLKTQVEGLLPQ